MSRVKVGVIGAGGIAHAHLPRLAERSDAVELVGVADINTANAQSTAEKYGARRHVADYNDFLPDVDAVVICVPTHLHSTIAIAALQADKHVFCEKPLTRTREQADALAAAATASRGALQIGFVRRFDAEWLAWREAVLAGKIGKPVVWRHLMAGSGPSASPWFYHDESGGGPFLDGCIHNIDFALHTFGPAEWTFAHLRTQQPDHTGLDTGTATVRFAGGDELMLAWSWGLPQGSVGDRAFDLLGPGGAITWPGDGSAQDDRHRFVIDTGAAREDVWYNVYALRDAFRDQMDEFISVARGEATPRAGLTEGYESLRLALAILESGRSHQVVRLNP